MTTQLEQYIPNEEVGHGVFKGFKTTPFEQFLAEAKGEDKETVKENDAEAGGADVTEDEDVAENADAKEKTEKKKSVKEDDAAATVAADDKDKGNLEEPKDDDIKMAEVKGKKGK